MSDSLPIFHEWIQQQAGGTADLEMTQAIAAVVEAVNHRGKRGKVVLELTIEPAGDSQRNVAVGAKVIAKPPEPAPTPSIYFVGDQGSLHRDDPFARRLFDDAKSVETDTDDIKTLED